MREALTLGKPWRVVNLSEEYGLHDAGVKMLVKEGLHQHAAVLLQKKAFHTYVQQLSKLMDYEKKILEYWAKPEAKLEIEPKKLRVLRKTIVQNLKQAIAYFKKAEDYYSKAGKTLDANYAKRDRMLAFHLLEHVQAERKKFFT